jgi:hypothetical protein
MAKSPVKFVWTVGSTFTGEIIYYQQEEGGEVVNLDGYDAIMQLRPDRDSDTLFIELTTSNGLTIVPEEGKVIFKITPTTEMAGVDRAFAAVLIEPGVDGDRVDLLEADDVLIQTEFIRPEIP